MSQEENTPDVQPSLSNRRGLSGLADSLKEMFANDEKTYQKHIRVILNPASGQDEPALKIFNTIFHDAGYGWDVHITQQAGDATRLAKEAVAEGVDLIAVYGGDGSVMEVAAGMLGSQIPLGIIPGGTGNVISLSLGIPRDTAEACSLIVGKDPLIRAVDVGMAGDTPFMERIGVGLEAAVTKAADRDAKNKYGIFAYVISTLQALVEPEIVTYRLIIDGEQVESQGLSCVVANIGDLGVGNLSLAPDVDMSDGLLDVFVIRKADLVSLFSLAATVISGSSDNNSNMPHWKGREIQIEAHPHQAVQADGELIGHSPVSVKVVPQSLQVIVPPKPAKPGPAAASESSQKPLDAGSV